MRRGAIAKRLVGIVLLLAMPALGGCTAALINHAKKEEVRGAAILDVNAAWRVPGGDMVICATGWPAERSRGTKPVAFHLSVPLALFEAPGPSHPLLFTSETRIARYTIAPDRLGSGCPDRPEDARDIAIVTVSSDYFSSIPAEQASADQLRQFVDEADPRPALHVFAGRPGDAVASMLIYRHDAAVFDGSTLVKLTPAEQTVKPNEAAYLAVPIAFAADVVALVAVVVVFALAAVAAA